MPGGRAGLLAATALSLMLLLVFPVYAAATGVRLALTAGWLRSVPGLFVQAGVAEEVLFRGYLFGTCAPGARSSGRRRPRPARSRSCTCHFS